MNEKEILVTEQNEKLAYTTPELTIHGSLTQLTEAGAFAGDDGFGASTFSF